MSFDTSTCSVERHFKRLGDLTPPQRASMTSRTISNNLIVAMASKAPATSPGFPNFLEQCSKLSLHSKNSSLQPEDCIVVDRTDVSTTREKASTSAASSSESTSASAASAAASAATTVQSSQARTSLFFASTRVSIPFIFPPTPAPAPAPAAPTPAPAPTPALALDPVPTPSSASEPISIPDNSKYANTEDEVDDRNQLEPMAEEEEPEEPDDQDDEEQFTRENVGMVMDNAKTIEVDIGMRVSRSGRQIKPSSVLDQTMWSYTGKR